MEPQTRHLYMDKPPDILLFQNLIGADQLRQIEFLAAHAPFTDGRATASAAAKSVKHNLQIDLQDQQVLPTLRQILAESLQRTPGFHAAFYPLRIFPFLVSKYESGMGYGWHTDSPIMGNPPVRTDLAMTIFLSDPDTYDGGELQIQYAPDQVLDFKLPAGDAVVYPCKYVHCVREVTRGTRLVAVTWVHCAVRSAEQREVLQSLKNLYEQLITNESLAMEAATLQQAWSNLFRMWAEM